MFLQQNNQKYQKMGQRIFGMKLPLSSQDFQPSQWIYDKANHKGNAHIGYCQTYTNIKNERKIDQYQITINSSNQLDKCLSVFLWRKNRKFITKAYYLVPKFANQLCSENRNEAHIYIEHANYRLSQLKDIPFPETIYCGLALLKGYSVLYECFGQFEITEEQVCIDKDGKVTVWFHSDLSSYQKQQKTHRLNFERIWNKYNPRNSFNQSKTPQNNTHKSKEEEQQIVEKIMQMIFINTDHETQPTPSLQQYYLSFKLTNQADFQGTIKMFSEYMQSVRIQKPQKNSEIDQQIKIPQRMNSVILLNQCKLTKIIEKRSKDINDKHTQKNINKYYRKTGVLNTDRVRATERNNLHNQKVFFRHQNEKRPITNYCQSVPNKNIVNRFQDLRFQNLQKNKSSENFKNILYNPVIIFPQPNYSLNIIENNDRQPLIYSDRDNPKVRNKTIDSTQTEILPIIQQKKFKHAVQSFKNQNRIFYDFRQKQRRNIPNISNISNLSQNIDNKDKHYEISQKYFRNHYEPSKTLRSNRNDYELNNTKNRSANIFFNKTDNSHLLMKQIKKYHEETIGQQYAKRRSKNMKFEKNVMQNWKMKNQKKQQKNKDPFFKAERKHDKKISRSNKQPNTKPNKFCYFSTNGKQYCLDKDIAKDLQALKL